MNQIVRVVDIKHSIALVQYNNKLTKYVMTDDVPKFLIEKYKEEVKKERTI